jgi:ferredoxin
MSDSPTRRAITVVVDDELCAGHARCNALGPENYAVYEAGYCPVTATTVDVVLLDAARRGAARLPGGCRPNRRAELNPPN